VIDLWPAPSSSAPKVRNAPGKLPAKPEALKARHKSAPCCTPVLIPRLQRFDRNFHRYLGRWPRLLHHAPLALNATNNTSRAVGANHLLPD